MKINKLDLAKTISDFMFLGVDNPEEKAKKVFELKHKLDKNGHGFEKYIQYYFQKYHNYKVMLNGKTNEQDNGIDLKGIKKQDGKENYLIVQCKKHNVKDITYNDVASFYGKIAKNYIKYKDKINVYYITTTKFTKKAKDFLKEEGIRAIDFELIYKLQELYPLDDFKKELLDKEGNKEVYRSFSREQIQLNLDDNIINTVNATDKEVFTLLRQVRRDFSNSKQLKLGDIARNDTLELLARKRPHNLKALKKITIDFPTREKNKINKYGEIFIERLKYLHKEEIHIEEVKKDSFLKRLLNF